MACCRSSRPEFPLPDTKTKRHIFKLHTSRMSLADDVDLEELVMTKDDLSGADIKAVCSALILPTTSKRC